MSITVKFGNLSISDFEKKMGWNFEEKDKEWLETHRVESAQSSEIIANNGFHIFDTPFEVVCASEITDSLTAILLKYEEKSPIHPSLRISRWEKENEK